MWWRCLSGRYFVTSRSKTANFPINAFSTWVRSFAPTADLTVVKFPLRALFHRHLPRLSGTFCTAWSVYRIFVTHAWSSWKPFQMTLIVRPLIQMSCKPVNTYHPFCLVLAQLCTRVDIQLYDKSLWPHMTGYLQMLYWILTLRWRFCLQMLPINTRLCAMYMLPYFQWV